MKISWFTEAQIMRVLQQVEAGVPVPDLLHRYKVSRRTLETWRQRYCVRGAVEARRLKQLEDENRTLKANVAELELERQTLHDVLARAGAHGTATACPVCGEDMRRMGASKVEVETCKVHGVWLTKPPTLA